MLGSAAIPTRPAPSPRPRTHQCSQLLVTFWPGAYRCPCSLQWHWLTEMQPLPAMSSYTVPGTARDVTSHSAGLRRGRDPQRGAASQASHPQAPLVLWVTLWSPHSVWAQQSSLFPGTSRFHGPGRRRW